MTWPVNPLRGKTTDWRAVCGKSACTVRRGEGPNSIGPSYPYQCLSFARGNGVINEAGCWDYLVGMTLGPSTFPRYHRVGGPFRSPHRLAATCQPTANGSPSGGVALLRQSRSALRRS